MKDKTELEVMKIITVVLYQIPYLNARKRILNYLIDVENNIDA